MSLHSKAQKLSYKTLFLIIVFLLIPIILLLRINQKATPASAGWFNDAWGYRKAINIGNTGSTLTNIQIKLLDNSDLSALVTAGKLQASLNDLRFTDANGKLFSYWIEDATNNSVDIWGFVPSIPTGGATIYMYYGNSSATSVSSTKNITIGGSMTAVGGYRIHTFTANGTLTNAIAGNAEVLVVAGGGGGGKNTVNNNRGGGGGGAGGLIYNSSYSVTVATIGVTIGNGGVGSSDGGRGANGTNSVFGSLTATGGGGGGGGTTNSDGGSGGSGGGAGDSGNANIGGSGTTGQGYSGGNHAASAGNGGSGSGGGGANGIGSTGGGVENIAGGAGLTYNISGTSLIYAVGGIGGGWFTNYDGSNGSNNTGNGGGGTRRGTSGNGGSGIVIVRYLSATAGTPATEETSKAPAAYWSFDEGVGTTAYDSSSNKNNGVISGATWQTEDQCISGKCLYFNGTSAYINVPETSSLNLTTSGSISLWVKPITIPTSGNYAVIINKGNWSGDTNNYSLSYYNGPSLMARANPGNGYQTSSSITPISNWTYIEYTWNATASTLYTNGVLQKTWGAGNANTTGYSLRIGRAQDSSGYYFNGFIDEVKIYPYARSSAEIKADYAAGKAHAGSNKGSSANLGTNPKSSEAFSDGLVGYWKMDENSGTTTSDSSGNSNTATFGSGSSAPAWGMGKYGVGLSFNGSNYATITDNANLRTTTQSFSFWFKTNVNPAVFGGIISHKDSSIDGYNILQLSTGRIRVARRISGNWRQVDSLSSSTDGNWHHGVAVFDNTKIYFYVDGVPQGTDSDSSPTTFANSTYEFGTYIYSYNFTGSLDEVRIYNRALSPTEVKQLYEYAPGPVAYYNFNEGTGTTAFDSSGNNQSGSLSSGASWVPGKYSKGIKFNNSNNGLITIADNALQRPSEMTVSYWMYLNSQTTYGVPIVKTTSASWNDGWGFYNRGGNNEFTWWTTNYLGTSRYITITTPSIKTWHYVTGTFSQTNGAKLYIDGILSGSASSTTAITQSTSSMQMGYHGGGSALDGTIDEVKIYNYALTQKQIVSDMSTRGGSAFGGNAGSIDSAVAHWDFDEGYGNILRNSGNGGPSLNITLGTGTSAPAWTDNGKFGKALSFNPSDNDLTILADPADGSLDLGPGKDISWSIWIKLNGKPSSWSRVINKMYGTWNDGYFAYFNNSYIFNWSVFKTPIYQTWSATTDLTSYNNQWVHLVGTFTHNDSIKLYLNGTLVDNQTVNGDGVNSGAAFTVGGYGNGGSVFNGLLDEVKIYNYALTSDEVKTDYNQGKAIVMGSLGGPPVGGGNTNPATAGSQEYCVPGDTAVCSPPIARWDFNEGTGTTAYDTSGNGNHATFQGTPVWSNGKIGKAINFTDGQYLSTNFNWNTLTNATLEAWIKLPRGIGTSYDGIFGGVGGETNTLFLYNNSLYWRVNSTQMSKSFIPVTNNWYHIAVTKIGATGEIFINGVSSGTGIVGASFASSSLALATINTSTPEYSHKGLIDQVKIYNYARTPAQIALDYNQGKPIAWYDFDECQGAVIHDRSGNNLNGTLSVGASGSQNSVGTCSVGTSAAWTNGAVGKNNSSLNFDGTDDYVTTGSIPASETFSISNWFKPGTTITDGQRIYWGNGSNKAILAYSGTTGNLQWYVQTTGGTLGYKTSINKFKLNDWNHVVLIYDGSSVKLYINGILDPTTGSITGTSSASGINFGTNYNRTGNWFNGQIDDIQIYNYPLTATQIKTLYSGGSVNFR